MPAIVFSLMSGLSSWSEEVEQFFFVYTLVGHVGPYHGTIDWSSSDEVVMVGVCT